MNVKFALIMACGVFISSVSQILLKRSAAVNADASFLKQYLNRYVIIGYLLLLVAMLIPLYAYTQLDLKYGAVIESLGYVFVMLLSAGFLKEKVTPKKAIGNAMIVFGVILFSLNPF